MFLRLQFLAEIIFLLHENVSGSENVTISEAYIYLLQHICDVYVCMLAHASHHALVEVKRQSSGVTCLLHFTKARVFLVSVPHLSIGAMGLQMSATASVFWVLFF